MAEGLAPVRAHDIADGQTVGRFRDQVRDSLRQRARGECFCATYKRIPADAARWIAIKTSPPPIVVTGENIRMMKRSPGRSKQRFP